MLEDFETATKKLLLRLEEVRHAKTTAARDDAEAELYADAMVMREKSKTVAKFLSNEA